MKLKDIAYLAICPASLIIVSLIVMVSQNLVAILLMLAVLITSEVDVFSYRESHFANQSTKIVRRLNFSHENFSLVLFVVFLFVAYYTTHLDNKSLFYYCAISAFSVCVGFSIMSLAFGLPDGLSTTEEESAIPEKRETSKFYLMEEDANKLRNYHKDQKTKNLPYLFYSYQRLLGTQGIDSSTGNYEIIRSGFYSLLDLLTLKQKFVSADSIDKLYTKVKDTSTSDAHEIITKEIGAITVLLDETLTELITEIVNKKVNKNADTRKKLIELKGVK